jgi:hypothetical protein
MGMLRLTIVGDVQAVCKTVLEELGFGANEQLYRLAVSAFRRRVLPGLEEAFSNEIRRAAARRGLMLMVDVRGFRTRRQNGELCELRSQAQGPGAERIRVQTLENMWNERLYHTLRAFIEDNIPWMLSAVQSRPDGGWIA